MGFSLNSSEIRPKHKHHVDAYRPAAGYLEAIKLMFALNVNQAVVIPVVVENIREYTAVGNKNGLHI